MKIRMVKKKEANNVSVENSSTPVVDKDGKNPNSKPKFVIKLAFVVLFIASIVIGAYFIINNDDNEIVQNNQVCSDVMLKKAKPAIDPYRVDKTILMPIIKEIEKLPEYKTDVNCIYIALTYYSASGGVEQSEELLNKLKNMYNPKVGYSPIIKEIAWTPERFDPRVKSLLKRNNQYTPERGSGGGWSVE